MWLERPSPNDYNIAGILELGWKLPLYKIFTKISHNRYKEGTPRTTLNGYLWTFSGDMMSQAYELFSDEIDKASRFEAREEEYGWKKLLGSWPWSHL